MHVLEDSGIANVSALCCGNQDQGSGLRLGLGLRLQSMTSGSVGGNRDTERGGGPTPAYRPSWRRGAPWRKSRYYGSLLSVGEHRIVGRDIVVVPCSVISVRGCGIVGSDIVVVPSSVISVRGCGIVGSDIVVAPCSVVSLEGL